MTENSDKKFVLIQPPKNSRVVKALIKIILLYSAKKNKANPIAEYSTLYPLTNSLSASGKSKGARFVSANILTRNIKNSEKNGTAKNTQLWKVTISIKLNEPTQSNKETNIRPIQTS